MEIDLASTGVVINGESDDPHLINGEDKTNITTNTSLPAYKLKFKMRVLAAGVTSNDELRVLISPRLTRIDNGNVYHYYSPDSTQHI